ncbi:MAG: MFS transporter [Chloroflexi bacterium]|uniref:MFS transporter n=1 Tax=Candidatus Chlorohelix allophototropha TaxID=3003348 RepID=A0A8T7LZD8_9CHLR|nr:MFS transporter [Chloroflexota bacterium]WJW67532.1 MFS transporter [Chloroflexota bacterium L227-S17]
MPTKTTQAGKLDSPYPNPTLKLEEAGNTPLAPDSNQFKKLLKAVPAYFARGAAALHHRNYRLFFFGQLVSLIGTWMQNLAQGWLVLKITNDPLALGLVTALQFLPVMFLTLFGGIIADRLPKRRTLLFTQTSAMSLAFILATLVSFNIVQLWEIYVLATMLGLVNAVDMPVRQSFVSEMVGKEELMNAVALNSSIFNAARVVGPAVAGLLIGWIGIAPAFWLNGFSFVAVLTGLFLMRDAELFGGIGKKPTGKIFVHLKEGLGYTLHTPAVNIIMILVGIVGLLGVNFNVWIPVLANNYLKVGAEGYGILMSGIGVGALGRALTLAMAGKKPKHMTLVKGACFFSLFGFGVAISPFFWVSVALMVGLGASMSNVMASANTLVQMITPDNLRGRVMSVYMLVFAGTTPIGGLLAGWLASVGGTPFSMGICMVLSFMSVPIAWILMNRNRESLESL